MEFWVQDIEHGPWDITAMAVPCHSQIQASSRFQKKRRQSPDLGKLPDQRSVLEANFLVRLPVLSSK